MLLLGNKEEGSAKTPLFCRAVFWGYDGGKIGV